MEKTRVVIMGAGLGGLGAGVKLKEAGIEVAETPSEMADALLRIYKP